jgi:hypothetical protein
MRYLILFLLLSLSSKAQVVSYVKYKHEADLVVYEVDYKWQADICYVITEHKYKAGGGVWWISEEKRGIKLYKAKYRHEADILVFKVRYEHDIKGRIDEQ